MDTFAYGKGLQSYEKVELAILNSFPIEKRLAGLTPEQVLIALPNVLLRALDKRYVASLPVELQEKIQRKLRET